MPLSHTDLATMVVKEAVEEAMYAIGRVDDLLTDDQLSRQMVKNVLKNLKLNHPDLTLENWCLENIDADAVDDEPLLKTPFLKSMREVRMLLGLRHRNG